MPVDPFGNDTGSYHSPDEGIWYPDYGGYDDYSLSDLISQGINQAARTAQIIGAGYPPGSTITYSPQVGQTPQPLCGPNGCSPTTPTIQPQTQAGVGGSLQLSNTTLMLIVGGALLFMLGKRGR